MNKIFTLFVMAVVCLVSNTANAQVNENFSSTLPSCWLTTEMSVTSGRVNFLNNHTSYLGTPYINITSESVSISFKYGLSGNLNGSKTRTFQVGYQTKSGSFIALSNIVDVTAAGTYNSTFTIPNGINRVVIKGTSDGSPAQLYIDDLTVSGNAYHYAEVCNSVPEVKNDTFNVAGYALYASSKSLLNNDTDKNTTETLSAAIVTQSTDGIATINTDGTFTFKWNADFTGTFTTFTYRATDNGYDPENSIATVRINFSEASILPVKIISFAGSINGGKASLTWNVAENETGYYFEVQKSTDGKSYNNAGILFNTAKAGTEIYQHTDANELTAATYYRLKVVNKDNTTSYSKVVLIKNSQAIADSKLTLMQNPVQSTLSFAFTSDVKENTEIAVYNMAGVKVFSQQMGTQKGANSIGISLDSKIIKGNYILTIQNSTGIKTAKFIKQ